MSLWGKAITRERAELRVHGIGDHDYLSALGPARVTTVRHPDAPDTAVPPTAPQHPVLLLNWSRTSRHGAGIAWYLALPFTLVNVAAHMVRKGPAGPRWTLWIASVLAGVVLTVTAQVWLIALAENVARQLRATYSSSYSGASIVIAVTALLALLIVSRWVKSAHRISRRSEAKMKMWRPTRALAITSALNLTVVVVLGVVMVTWPPTQVPFEVPLLSIPVPESVEAYRQIVNDYPGGVVGAVCAAHAADSDLIAWRLNPLAAVVLGGFGFALAVFLLLLVGALIFGGKKLIATFSGAALMIGVAITLLNAVGATLRLGVEWIMTYLDTFVSLGWIARPENDLVNDSGGLSENQELLIAAVSQRFVMSLQGGPIRRCHESDILPPYSTTYYLDSLPLVGLLGLLALAFGLWVINRRVRQRITRAGDLPAKQVRLEFAHVVVTGLGARLWIGMLIAIVVWITLVLLVWVAVTFGISGCEWCSRFILDLVRVTAQLVAIGAVVFVISGHPQSVRRILAMVADIAGFWDPSFHPLAGDTYRHRVMSGLTDEIERNSGKNVVLVGHSQGSVIAAWFSANRDRREFSLVTCGSPLVSLYETFFPGYFDEDFFRDVDKRTTGWRNLWRRTDPIATSVIRAVSKRNRDVRLTDPLPVEDRPGAPPPSVRGHSDYWTDPGQMAAIVGLMDEADKRAAAGSGTW